MVAVLALAVLLLVTDTALSVWERLAAAPDWVRLGWLVGVSAVTIGATLLAWRWLRPRPPSEKAPPEAAIDPAQLDEALAQAQADGIDVQGALTELAEQERRREGGDVYLAVFGEVSAGKSALVQALVPGADAPSDPRAGTTTDIRHHRWTSERGDRIVIADLPGFNLGEDERLLEEARRAHEVIFLTDGDLTASQFSELERLIGLDKPILLALNKIDRYTEAEQRALRDRLAEQTGLAPGRIVAIRSGGREEVIRLLSDGREVHETRDRGADVEPLRRAVQSDLDRNAELMGSLQDTAVLLLAAEKLGQARQAHRSEQADALVSTYSRRAVVGALAAVAPGSDLVIQGVLATRLIQELCAVYDVSVKDVEIESFLKLAGGRVRKMSALTLAIGGNALKAFPGIGTLTGGLLHAVAYGMIFDSLGRAASDTLATRGDLRALPAARAFEENLTDALENHAGRFARMALREARDVDAS